MFQMSRNLLAQREKMGRQLMCWWLALEFTELTYLALFSSACGALLCPRVTEYAPAPPVLSRFLLYIYIVCWILLPTPGGCMYEVV